MGRGENFLSARGSKTLGLGRVLGSPSFVPPPLPALRMKLLVQEFVMAEWPWGRGALSDSWIWRQRCSILALGDAVTVYQ